MLNRMFEIGFKKVENKTKFFIKLFNKELMYNLGQAVDFYWKKDFLDYFHNHDMQLKIQKLKQNLDDVSCEYIDNFMTLIKYWDGTLKRKVWTKYDLELFKKYRDFEKTFIQPFDEITDFNPFLFFYKYGLNDLPKSEYENINGKTIIDIGGYNGDTAYMFHKNFPDSNIRIYEPLSKNILTINLILEKEACNKKIIPIQKGLGEKSETTKIEFNTKELAQINTLDNELELLKEPIGLIKMDVEGFESKVFKGAINTIKKYKPILLIAIYHKGEDFFEMKEKIENLNLGYKFMIRRSEAVLPQADLVLIAY